jgi:hypothetical protein
MMMTGFSTSATGSGAAAAAGASPAPGASGSSWSLRYSAVILSSELEATLAAAMPSSFALERTTLFSSFSSLAIS